MQGNRTDAHACRLAVKRRGLSRECCQRHQFWKYGKAEHVCVSVEKRKMDLSYCSSACCDRLERLWWWWRQLVWRSSVCYAGHSADRRCFPPRGRCDCCRAERTPRRDQLEGGTQRHERFAAEHPRVGFGGPAAGHVQLGHHLLRRSR